MFEIEFLKDDKGVNETEAFILELEKTKLNNKEHNVLLNKIYFYFQLVEKTGTRSGSKVIKQIKGKIWELRPLDFRFMLYINKSKIYVLNFFRKKSEKTPEREIKKAERLVKKLLEK